jgi:hemerythrin-like metal-binding protein
MAFINWSDELSVQIKSIDDQHKILIEQINMFCANFNIGSKTEKMENLIKAMKDYTIFHFSTEEKYMKQLNYPEYNSHKAEHDKFVETVTDYEERYKNGRLLLSVEITFFIKEWVSTHILVTDKKYSEFFTRNGIK